MSADDARSYLVDTNVLLRRAQRQSAEHQEVTEALDHLLAAGRALFVTPQILMEYWSVATRPAHLNGLGLTPDTADEELTILEGIFDLVPEGLEVYPTWRRLVRAHRVSGRQVHDAHIVASMESAGIPTILTFNQTDFIRYRQISILLPADISSDKS
jgi:predicted nucleic acid-binding protein